MEDEYYRELILDAIESSVMFLEDEIEEGKWTMADKEDLDDIAYRLAACKELYFYVKSCELPPLDSVFIFTDNMLEYAKRKPMGGEIFMSAYSELSAFLGYLQVVIDDLEGEENETESVYESNGNVLQGSRS